MSTSPGARSGSGAEASGTPSDEDLLQRYDIVRLRAPNPGPLTLAGTNTWLVGRAPTWVVDPGPLLVEHMQRMLAAIDARGGLGGVALTHDHSDHSEAVDALLEQRPAPLAAGRGDADLTLAEGADFGPFQAVATPGHAPDHFALVAGRACFTGDAVLGEGSVFISPYPGAMAGYLMGLERLSRRGELEILCPGHGPTVWDPHAKLQEYVRHRMARESALRQALGEGRRSAAELLDAVWPDVPGELRPLAAVTLAAHLDKLAEEQALPADVERPKFERTA